MPAHIFALGKSQYPSCRTAGTAPSVAPATALSAVYSGNTERPSRPTFASALLWSPTIRAVTCDDDRPRDDQQREDHAGQHEADGDRAGPAAPDQMERSDSDGQGDQGPQPTEMAVVLGLRAELQSWQSH